jgi:hypothetical protein
VAPGKFIPTFAILYGGPKSERALKEAARFDLIDAGAHAVSDANTWRALKLLNPHLKVFIYQLGPGEFSADSRLHSGPGWDWITANHGLASADRWTAIGATHGGYLQVSDYPNERLMIIGNPAWQQYWLDGVFNSFWSSKSPNRDADGVYADNMTYRMPYEGDWYSQGHPEGKDVAAEYYRSGVYQAEIWKAQAKAFLARAVPWLADRHCQLILNFGYSALYPQYWPDLDSMPHPVFGAMEEGAFATPWGVRGRFDFYSEQGWLQQVNAMRHLQHVRALMCVHGPIVSPKADLSRMDFTDDGGGNRGWDVLWFGLTSFLQGYDDVRQNAYLSFTVWSYSRAYWLDEFDPAHLNLGRALGESYRVDAAVGHCYLREFDAGWAVVNPTATDAHGIAVPGGQARVLDHYSFEHSELQPLVTRFELPAHRGVVLLKPGRRVGSTDQQHAGSSNGN